MARVMHSIEKQSYEILRTRVDTSALPPWTRAVVERVIHASADLGYLDDLVCAEADLAAGVQALLDGAPVVADSAMTAAGITARGAICRIDDRRAAALVIGLPVGFVGAVEAKQALRDSGLPTVTNRSEKGGAAVAAAALNALLYGDPLDDKEQPS